jgi:tetratricopeptide (TPR) repeat protein
MRSLPVKRAIHKVSVVLNKTLLATFLVASPVLVSFTANTIDPSQTLFVSGVAHAQVKAKNKKFEKRSLPTVGESVGKKLQEAYDFLQPPPDKKLQPNPKKVIEIMTSIPTAKLNPAEAAKIHQLSAYAYAQQENYSKAIESFEKLLALSPNIAVADEQSTLLILSQLYGAQDNPKKALASLTKWTDYVAEIKPEQYNIFATLYYQLDDKKNALLNINEAVKLQEQAGKVPAEGWYNMQRGLYLDQEDYKSTLVVVEKLIQHYSKASYWKTLSQLYGILEKPSDRVAALEACYLMGGLTNEKDLTSLAALFWEMEAPYKAAKVMEKGIYTDKLIEPTAKNLKFLADVLRAARDDKKSLVEYEKAAQKSTDGDLILGLAEMYMLNDKYKDASKWAKEAIAKSVKRADRANMTVGQAEYELKNYDAAITYFQRAAKDERSAKFANQWIAAAEREKKKAEIAAQ